MAKKPVLVVMAAGMGSRYGGLKQIDPVGSQGEAILDYSIYDAHEACVEKVVIVIKEAIRKDFMELVGPGWQRLLWRFAMLSRNWTSCRRVTVCLRVV